MADPILEQVTERRALLGWTQQQLADAAGTSQSAICELETGVVSPTLRTLRRVMWALGLRLTVESLPPDLTSGAALPEVAHVE